MARRPQALEECPNCGATFRAGRLACPECGSDAATGWKGAEEIDYQSVELPDEDAPAATRRLPMVWVVAAILAILGMIVLLALR